MRKSVLAALAALTTVGVAVPAHAAFPGAPGRIAVVNDSALGEPGEGPARTGQEIWTVNPDNTDWQRLTNNDGAINDTEPAWSPNGRRIAFASNRTGTYQVHTMRQDGAQVFQVTHGSQDARDPAWSPDGLFLVFVRGDDLWLTTVIGFPTWRLTNTPGVAESMPAWSPLGVRIAYVVTPAVRDAQIWTIRVDGSGAQNLTTVTEPAGLVNDTGPNYTPDGQRISFASNRLNTSPAEGPSAWTMRTDGTDPIRLTTSGFQSGVAGVAVSPDGSRFAGYSCSSFDCFVPIFTHPTDGSPAVRVGAVAEPFGDGHVMFPDWQPLR
jgi:TolB protein